VDKRPVPRAGKEHIHVPIVLKSGILSLLEPSRPAQGLLYLDLYRFLLVFKMEFVSNRLHFDLTA
jgi:hypothetical protein